MRHPTDPFVKRAQEWDRKVRVIREFFVRIGLLKPEKRRK